MPLKKSIAAAIAVSALIASSAALADEAQKLYTQSLAATCANCHGTRGHALEDAVVPGLAGQDAAQFVAKMLAYKKGEREATIMHQIAKGYSEEQIRLLGEYFAAQQP